MIRLEYRGVTIDVDGDYQSADPNVGWPEHFNPERIYAVNPTTGDSVEITEMLDDVDEIAEIALKAIRAGRENGEWNYSPEMLSLERRIARFNGEYNASTTR